MLNEITLFVMICIESAKVVTENQFFSSIKNYLKNVVKKIEFEIECIYLDHSIKEKNKDMCFHLLRSILQKYNEFKIKEIKFYIYHDDDKKEHKSNIDLTYEIVKEKSNSIFNNIDKVFERIYDTGTSFDYFIYQLFNDLQIPTNKELDNFVKTNKFKKKDINFMNELKRIVKEKYNCKNLTHIEIIKLCSETKSEYAKIFKELLKYIDY